MKYLILILLLIVNLSVSAFEEFVNIDGYNVNLIYSDNPHRDCVEFGARYKTGQYISGCYIYIVPNGHLIVLPYKDDPRYTCLLEHEVKHMKEHNWSHPDWIGC